MFVRVKATPNSPRKWIQLVESVRVKDRVKQKTIHHVGIALDGAEEQKLKNNGHDLMLKSPYNAKETLNNGCFLTPQRSRCWSM